MSLKKIFIGEIQDNHQFRYDKIITSNIIIGSHCRIINDEDIRVFFKKLLK